MTVSFPNHSYLQVLNFLGVLNPLRQIYNNFMISSKTPPNLSLQSKPTFTASSSSITVSTPHKDPIPSINCNTTADRFPRPYQTDRQPAMRAFANTPKHRRINPPYSHNDSGVQSGSKSRVDYEEIADEIEDDRKHYESRIRQMSKEWGLERNALRTERSTLRAEIKRLEFIIWNWEELDRKREADQSLKKANKQVDDDEIDQLRDLLRQTEAEKTELQSQLEALQKQIKKLKGQNKKDAPNWESLSFGQRSARTVNNPEFNPSTSRMKKDLCSLQQKLNQHYSRILSQKDASYNQLLRNFEDLQDQLQQQRHDTTILLERRTVELERAMEKLKGANEMVVNDLKKSIEGLEEDLELEREKVRLLEEELAGKDQEVGDKVAMLRDMKAEIMNLHQNLAEFRYAKVSQSEQDNSWPGTEKHNKKDVVTTQTQTFIGPTVIEQSDQRQNSWSQKIKPFTENQHTQTLPPPPPIHTSIQTTPPCCYNSEVQVSIEGTDHANFRIAQTLNEQIDKLRRQVAHLQAKIEEMQIEAAELRKGREPSEELKRLQKNCNQLARENNRLQQMIINTASKQGNLDNSRIHVHLKDIAQNDLKLISNPEIVREISQLRLFRSATSKQLERLRNQNQTLQRDIQTFKKSQQYNKILLNTEDRLMRNSYEVNIHNLNSQLNTMKTKLEGLQTRLDIKTKELNSKDEFVRNVIVSRVGKQVDETEMQYLSKRLDEFVSKQQQVTDK